MRPEYGDTMRRYLEGARQAIAEGNAGAAANYYRLAQQIAPTDPAIGTALAACSGVSADARASSDRAVTLVLLGDNAARAKQWGVAADAYEEAASLVGKDPTVLYKLAGALYRSGSQLDRANKLVEESIALSRNRVEPWLLLAQIRWESGARSGAREALEEARRLRPDDERVTKLLIKFGSVR
jgi:cytochrome c-type biogenesis protein CcmH/NrfG